MTTKEAIDLTVKEQNLDRKSFIAGMMLGEELVKSILRNASSSEEAIGSLTRLDMELNQEYYLAKEKN